MLLSLEQLSVALEERSAITAGRRMSALMVVPGVLVALEALHSLSRTGSETSDGSRSSIVGVVDRKQCHVLVGEKIQLLLQRQLPCEVRTEVLVAALEPRYVCWRTSFLLRSEDGGGDARGVIGSCSVPGRSAGPKREMMVVMMTVGRG